MGNVTPCDICGRAVGAPPHNGIATTDSTPHAWVMGHVTVPLPLPCPSCAALRSELAAAKAENDQRIAEGAVVAAHLRAGVTRAEAAEARAEKAEKERGTLLNNIEGEPALFAKTLASLEADLATLRRAVDGFEWQGWNHETGHLYRSCVNTFTHSVTFVANNMLLCLQEIVRRSGLDPDKIAADWVVLERGLARWLDTKHLETVSLEVFNTTTDGLVGRWDFTIAYGWNGGTGGFWVDTDQIRYAILKQGLFPSTCKYGVIVHNKPGRPDVPGWSAASYRSTDGFIRQSIGTTLDASGLSAGAAYYRKA